MAMDMYTFMVLFGAVNYLSMYPLMQVSPWLWSKIFFVDLETFTDATVKSINGVFLLLLVVVSPTYLATLKYKYSLFIDVSVFQRMFIVFTCAFVTGLIGQDPFPNRNFVLVMFIVDVLGGVGHGTSHPQGLSGVFGGMWKLFKSTPTNAFNKALRVEAHIGMTYGLMACVYAAVVADVKMGIVISMLSTIIVYLWIWFHAVDQSDTPRTLLIFYRLLVASTLLYHSEVVDFGALNIVFRLEVISLIGAIVTPYLGALSAASSTLYLYKIASDYTFTIAKGAFYWLGLWGVVTVITSYGWLFLFYKDYDEKQKKRVMRTHWQDRILGLFCFLVGAVLEKAGYLEIDSIGAPVVYLLPPVTLWFTLETKMLNHMQVGTPFHPSWWIDGDVPEFSPTDYVNVTFGVATALITVVLTSYAFYAVNTAVSFSSLAFSTDDIWKFAVAHGILFIWSSGMWMILASSGVPPIGDGKAFRIFPPELPALLQANPHNCVPLHKVDLVIGHFLMLLGAFYLDGTTDSTKCMAVKAMVGGAWAYTILRKIITHYQDWGFEPKVKHKKA